VPGEYNALTDAEQQELPNAGAPLLSGVSHASMRITLTR
jgi:hypothetical protein